MTTSDTRLPDAPQRLVETLERAAKEWRDLPFLGIHSVRARPSDIEYALGGTFRHHDERFPLVPPVDWWDEPYRGANERGFFQNSFIFADPLLADPRFPEVIAPLADIFADWLIANPRSGAAHPHRYAWHDHAAAGRIAPMSFVLREGIRRDLLDRSIAEALAAGVLEHARYLMAEENYAAHNNHGFASDAALALTARNLAPAPAANEWAAIAERRIVGVLDRTIDREEALHLEHSPAYHWIICGALARFADRDIFKQPDLVDLTRRMEESGAWLVAPDGTLPPLGDTSMAKQPPRRAAAIAETRTGMKVFPSTGYAAVRARESALFVTAAHHPTAHKHADDGSFCLYEGGRPIVLDSGNPGYEYDSPEFEYGTSPRAHATISVDGFDWAKRARAYGSGMVASAEGGGLYGLLTRNPNAVPEGGAAQRTLVYAPAQFLLVLDEVEASGDHRLTRHLPLAPGLEARPHGHDCVEILEMDSRLAWLVQIPLDGASTDRVDIVSGQRTPELRGFCFTSPEAPRAACDVALSGSAGTPRAYALVFAPPDPGRPLAMSWSKSDGRANVVVKGITASPLEIGVEESALQLGLAS